MTASQTIAAAALLSACAWPLHAAPSAPAPDARAAIQSAYDRQAAAVGREDTAGLAATLAPGFVQVDQRTGETQSEGQFLNMGLTFALFRSVEAKTTILNVTLSGGRAVVTSRSRAVLVPQGVGEKAGTVPPPLVLEGLSVDTWVKNGPDWLQQRAENL